MLRLIAPLCALVLLVFGAADAQEYTLKNTVQLAPYEKIQLDIPRPLPVPGGKKVYLSFEPRIDASSYKSGSAYAFRVYFDRLPLTIERLANKQNSYYLDAVSQAAWYSDEGSFRALYDEFDKPAPATLGKIHRFVFDITDLVSAGKDQHVIIENLFDSVSNSQLAIRDCKLVIAESLEKHPYPKNPLPYYLSHGFDWARARATSYHRGIDARLDTETDYKPKVSVSVPVRYPRIAGSWETSPSLETKVVLNGWNPIPIRTQIGTAQNGWQDERHLAQFHKGDKLWETAQYRLQRKISADEHGLVVQDVVTNMTDEALPFVPLYQVDVGNSASLKEFRLFGKPEKHFFANSIPGRGSASYPVAYIRDQQRAYAVVMEDDALRTQGSVMAWDEKLNFGTDMFYLQPRASHTFQFRLIAAAGHDYFEVLTRLRAAWDLYETIPGLFGFVYPKGIDAKLQSAAHVKSFFESTGITIPAFASSSAISDTEKRMVYGSEPPEMIAQAFTESTQPFLALMQQADVKYPSLLYMDPHLIRSDGKKEILQSVQDDLVQDIHGHRLDYRTGWLHVVLPQADNAVDKNIKKTLEYYAAQPGVGGMFLDEWDHSRARYSFQKEDGFTARLNPDLSILQKIGIIPLLAKDFQQQTIQQLQARNALIYVNQMDQTEAAQKLRVIHFAEPTQYDHYLLRSAQISRTPLSLNLKRSTSVWSDTYEFLKSGVLLCYYAKRLYGDHLLKHLYPIKVLSSQAGIVVGEDKGKDKIVTLRSGNYSFEKGEPLEALVFSAPGGNLRRTVASTPDADGKHRIQLNFNAEEQEIALVRPSAR